MENDLPRGRADQIVLDMQMPELQMTPTIKGLATSLTPSAGAPLLGPGEQEVVFRETLEDVKSKNMWLMIFCWF